MRTYSHIIDTKSIKKVLNSIPDYWVVRDLSERDYGIDLLVEIFNETDKDSNGRRRYHSTGYVCNIQVKGTNQTIKKNLDNTIHYPFEKKAMLYMERFPIPFIILRVDVSTKGVGNIYFLWLQRYIKDILDDEKPNWRDSEQQSFTLKIPSTNILATNYKKIEIISSYIKYREELIEFIEIFGEIHASWESLSKNIILRTDDAYMEDKLKIKKISRLTTLLSMNKYYVVKSFVGELYDFVCDIEKNREKEKLIFDYPHKYEFECLLNGIGKLSAVENFYAGRDDDVVY